MKFFGATLVFLAELGMLAGFAFWGFHAADGALGWILAVAAPAVAVTIWGAFLAPRARRPLKPAMVAVIVRLDLLLLGAAAAYFTGAKVLGIATAALAIVGTLLAGIPRPGDQDLFPARSASRTTDPGITDPAASVLPGIIEP